MQITIIKKNDLSVFVLPPKINGNFWLTDYENGKKINYMSYIKQMQNEECNRAINEIFINIDVAKIEKFIDDIECMSRERKEFYKKVIEIRYKIIKGVYEKINA